MNGSGRRGRKRPLGDRPRVNFGIASSKEGDEPEQVVAGANHAEQAGLLQPRAREKLGAIGRVELCDLSFERGADRNDLRAFVKSKCLETGKVWVLRNICERGFVDVRHVKARLGGKKGELAHQHLPIRSGKRTLLAVMREERADGAHLVQVSEENVADLDRQS